MRRCLRCFVVVMVMVVNVFASIESLTVTCPRSQVSPHHYYVCLTKSAVTTTTTLYTIHSSLSELLMEIKKVSLFLLEVYLQSLQDQRRAVYIVSPDRTKGAALFIFQSCLQTSPTCSFYSLAESCCSLVLSLPTLCFILLTEEMFSQSGV